MCIRDRLHTTPLPKLEEMADDQKEEEIAQTVAEKKTVEEAPAPEWGPIVPEAERRTAERFSQKDEQMCIRDSCLSYLLHF